MSETGSIPWLGDKWARYWDSPAAQYAVLACSDGSFVLETHGIPRVKLTRKTMKAACREAESIIAARCRDTLGLLGET